MRIRLFTLLVAAIAFGAPVHASSTDEDASVVALLEQTDAVVKLRAKGPAVLPVMLRVLTKSPLPAVGKKRLVAAFATFKTRDVLPVIRSVITETSDDATRIAACEVLGACADAPALPLLFSASGPRPGWRVRQALRDAMASLLRRVPSAIKVIRRDWRHIPAGARRSVLAAIGDTENPVGLDLLADHLAFRPEHETTIINAIARLAPFATPAQADVVAEQLRDRLDPSNLSVCQAASLALAGLQDRPSVPLLIDLLNSDAPGVKENAHWALRRVTGRSFPKRAEPWAQWYEAEERWFDSEAPALLAQLDSDQNEEVATALRMLAPRIVFRRELATAIAPVVWHESAMIGGLACQTLAHLGSRAAVPALLEALEQEDVADAASQALKAITGESPLKSDETSDTPEIP